MCACVWKTSLNLYNEEFVKSLLLLTANINWFITIHKKWMFQSKNTWIPTLLWAMKVSSCISCLITHRVMESCRTLLEMQGPFRRKQKGQLSNSWSSCFIKDGLRPCEVQLTLLPVTSYSSPLKFSKHSIAATVLTLILQALSGLVSACFQLYSLIIFFFFEWPGGNCFICFILLLFNYVVQSSFL